MVRSHERSPSPDGEPSLLKRLKMSHISSASDPTVLADPTPHFAPDILAPNSIHRLHSEYTTSEPFKYAVIEKLFQDELLKGVKDECLSELSFTEKETDIYKVNQTGDLASLSFLTESQIALLPNLLTLRDALYSEKFRSFLRAVTGCGPLSGSKQDMSVNTYTKGCHLLTHDDVIGTRRVSYILYMPLPSYQGWQKDWGGALELYPVQTGPDGTLEPKPIPAKCIPPSWNQFIFFEVQPGRSFHSVEEVVVGEGEDGRQRLSISGWFHSVQPGELGYEPLASNGDVKSSREQLAASTTVFQPYSEDVEPPLPDQPLSEEHRSFLSEFLNPVYLQSRTMKTLATRFVEESSLELHSFLSGPLSEKLEKGLAENDIKDGFGPDREIQIPPHNAGTDGPWMIRGPPHKYRYCVLKPHEVNGRVEAVFPLSAHSPDEIIRHLQDELFPSPAFRAWLGKVSRLLPLRYSSEARRFRPGLDYTLATSEEKEARLDVVLGLTPNIGVTEGSSVGVTELKGWQTGEWGGWECYMAPHEGEDDPAVYRSGSRKKATNGEKVSENAGNADHATESVSSLTTKGDAASDQMDADEDEVAEDDGTLLTVQPGFNRLLLVLRDEGVMRFVKYVSAAAEGARWDVCGEYECGAVEEMSD